MSDELQPRRGVEEGLSPATKAVWAGEDESLVQGATQVPVVYSAAYGYPDVDEWLDVALGRKPGHIYSRNTNPTVHAFEEKVRILEGAQAATSFATGMAAVSNTLFALLQSGDRVVSVKDTYGGTNRVFIDFLPRVGVRGRPAGHQRPRARRGSHRRGLPRRLPGDAHQPDAQGDGHRASGRGCARRRRCRHRRQHLRHAHQPEPAGAGRRPRAAQRHQVPGRATRTRSAACSCGDPELVAAAFHYREITGATLDPMAAYLLVRGMKTLALRIRQQNEQRAAHRALAAGAAGRRGRLLSGPRDAPAPRCRGAPDARLRRRAQFHAGGRLRGREARAAPAPPRPPRRQPRRRGDHRRPAGHDEPRGVHAPRSARRWASPRGSSATPSASRTPTI